MRLIADGDISNGPLLVTTRDEIGNLVIVTNEMNEKLHDLLTRISEVYNTVSSHSEELIQSSAEVKLDLEQIALTIKELTR